MLSFAHEQPRTWGLFCSLPNHHCLSVFFIFSEKCVYIYKLTSKAGWELFRSLPFCYVTQLFFFFSSEHSPPPPLNLQLTLSCSITIEDECTQQCFSMDAIYESRVFYESASPLIIWSFPNKSWYFFLSFSSRNTRQPSNSSDYVSPTKRWNMSQRIQIHSICHRCSFALSSIQFLFLLGQLMTSLLPVLMMRHRRIPRSKWVDHITHGQALDRTHPNGPESNEATTCYWVSSHVQQFIMWDGCHSRNGTASHQYWIGD